MTRKSAPMPPSTADRLWESALGVDPSFLLARANAVSVAMANAALADWGLKVRSYAVLAVAVDGMRPTQREVSDFLRLDPSQTVALIDDLQRAGLVTREVDPNDRRANVVVPTLDGVRVWGEAGAALEAAQASRIAALSTEERAELTRALRILAASE